MGFLGSIAIGGISVDSRKTRSGDLFVALRGGASDGHSFLGSGGAGAAAALVDREVGSPPLPCVRVPSTAAALPAVAVRFHGDPSSRLAVIGVTGTNGKRPSPTSSNRSSTPRAGTAVIGSVNYRLPGRCCGRD